MEQSADGQSGLSPRNVCEGPCLLLGYALGGPSQGLQKSLEVLDSGGSHGPKATWRDSEDMGLGT